MRLRLRLPAVLGNVFLLVMMFDMVLPVVEGHVPSETTTRTTTTTTNEKVKDNLDHVPSSSSSSFSDSLLLLCTADGQLYAFDAWTGHLSSQISTNALLKRSESATEAEAKAESVETTTTSESSSFPQTEVVDVVEHFESENNEKDDDDSSIHQAFLRQVVFAQAPLAGAHHHGNQQDNYHLHHIHDQCLVVDPTATTTATTTSTTTATTTTTTSLLSDSSSSSSPSSSSASNNNNRRRHEQQGTTTQKTVSTTNTNNNNNPVTSTSILPGLDGRLYYWLKKKKKKKMKRANHDHPTQDDHHNNNNIDWEEEEEYDDEDEEDDEEELQALPITIEGLLEHPVKSCEEEGSSIGNECGILTATMETSLLAVNERGQLLWSDTAATTTTTTTSTTSTTADSMRQLVLQRKDYHVRQISTHTGQQVWNVTLGTWQALDFGEEQEQQEQTAADDSTTTRSTTTTNDKDNDPQDSDDFLLLLEGRVQDKRETLAEGHGGTKVGNSGGSSGSGANAVPGDTYWWEQEPQHQQQHHHHQQQRGPLTTSSSSSQLPPVMPSVVFSTGKVVLAVHPTTHAVLWKLETSSAVASVFGIHKGRWKSLQVLSESELLSPLSLSASSSSATATATPQPSEHQRQQQVDDAVALVSPFHDSIHPHRHNSLYGFAHQQDSYHEYYHHLYNHHHHRRRRHHPEYRQNRQGLAAEGSRIPRALPALPMPASSPSTPDSATTTTTTTPIDHDHDIMMRIMCPPPGGSSNGGGGDLFWCPDGQHKHKYHQHHHPVLQLRLPSPTTATTTTTTTASANTNFAVLQPEGLLLSWKLVGLVTVVLCTVLAVGGRLWYLHKKRSWMERIFQQQQQQQQSSSQQQPRSMSLVVPPPKTPPIYTKSRSLEGGSSPLLESESNQRSNNNNSATVYSASLSSNDPSAVVSPSSMSSSIMTMRRCFSLPDHAQATSTGTVSAGTPQNSFRSKRVFWGEGIDPSGSNNNAQGEVPIEAEGKSAAPPSRSHTNNNNSSDDSRSNLSNNENELSAPTTASLLSPAVATAAVTTTTTTAAPTTALALPIAAGGQGVQAESDDDNASNVSMTMMMMMTTTSNIPLVRYSRYASEYKEVGPLGKGGFGSVFKCRNVLDGREYAIKKVSIRGCSSGGDGGGGASLKENFGFEQRLERTLREVKILAVLDHPNIVRYFGAWLEIEKQDQQQQQQQQRDMVGTDDETNALSRCYSSSMITESVSQWPARAQHHRHNNHRNLGSTFSSSEDSSSSYVPRSTKPLPPVYNAHRRLSMEDYGFIFEGSEQEEEETTHNNCDAVSNDDGTDKNGSYQPHQGSSLHPSLDARDSSTSVTASSIQHEANHFATATSPTPPRRKAIMRHTLYIQMQLCSQRTVGDFLSDSNARQGTADYASTTDNNKAGIDVPLALRLFFQIAQAVRHVHEQGLIHRDLKPQNCFMDDLGNVKVGDFGLSRESADATTSKYDITAGQALTEPSSMYPGDDHTAGVGTRAYASPEQMNGSDYDSSTDVYSLGIMLFELLYPMYTGMERNICLSRLRQQLKFPDDWDETVGQTCPTLREMVRSMLSRDPSARPNAASVAQHIQSILNEFTIVSLDDNFRLLQGPDVILLRVEAEHRPDALFQTIQAIEESAEETKHAVQIVQYGLRSSHRHHPHPHPHQSDQQQQQQQQPTAIMEFALKFSGPGSQLVSHLLQRPEILKVRQVTTNNNNNSNSNNKQQ